MGRHCCLSELRIHMKVEEKFSKFYPFETNIIEQLVAIEIDKRPNVDELLRNYGKEIEKKNK